MIKINSRAHKLIEFIDHVLPVNETPAKINDNLYFTSKGYRRQRLIGTVTDIGKWDVGNKMLNICSVIFSNGELSCNCLPDEYRIIPKFLIIKK